MNEIVESPFGAAPGAAAGAMTQTAGARQSQSRELAEMQTKFLMAQRFPRDERAAMDRILNAFARPRLAELAQYQYSRGGTDIVGPSINAAQAIAQQWGNIEFGWREVSRGVGADGVPFSEVEAVATDLQTITRRPIGFIVRHWRDTKRGGYALKDERDVYELCANQAQRRARACILAVVPQDVVEAAMQQAETTLKSKADTSPEAMAKMVEAFGPFGVTKEMIEKRIQRRLDAISAAQVVQLKRIYASLRDDMSEARDWFEVPEAAEQNASGIDAVRAAAAAANASGAAASTTAAPPPPAAKTTSTRGKREAGPTGAGDAQQTTGAAAPKGKTYAQFADAIKAAKDADAAALILDEARAALPDDQQSDLGAFYRATWATGG